MLHVPRPWVGYNLRSQHVSLLGILWVDSYWWSWKVENHSKTWLVDKQSLRSKTTLMGPFLYEIPQNNTWMRLDHFRKLRLTQADSSYIRASSSKSILQKNNTRLAWSNCNPMLPLASCCLNSMYVEIYAKLPHAEITSTSTLKRLPPSSLHAAACFMPACCHKCYEGFQLKQII